MRVPGSLFVLAYESALENDWLTGAFPFPGDFDMDEKAKIVAASVGAAFLAGTILWFCCSCTRRKSPTVEQADDLTARFLSQDWDDEEAGVPMHVEEPPPLRPASLGEEGVPFSSTIPLLEQEKDVDDSLSPSQVPYSTAADAGASPQKTVIGQGVEVTGGAVVTFQEGAVDASTTAGQQQSTLVGDRGKAPVILQESMQSLVESASLGFFGEEGSGTADESKDNKMGKDAVPEAAAKKQDGALPSQEKEEEEGMENRFGTLKPSAGGGGRGFGTIRKKAPRVSPAEKAVPALEGTNLHLEVITGPAAGAKLSRRTDKTSPWPAVTIGRQSGNDLPINDGQVSSRHAIVSWNALSCKWELVDRGSTNGTLLNGRPINPSTESDDRRDSTPMHLSDADIITCGSSSRILVRISQDSNKVESPPLLSPSCTPPGLLAAVASDPMRGRKGGKALPMEDVWVAQWPLVGVTSSKESGGSSTSGREEVGLFCVFDGHAGRAAADNAARIFPSKLSSLLSSDSVWAALQSECDSTELLREAFHQTEAELPNEDEGCTATVLLLWVGAQNRTLWAQCGNLGDSHCVVSLRGSSVLQLTEDHRLTGPVEKDRLASIGKPLKDGEKRLCGMNIARVLGDKFLKQQQVGLSSDPFISQPVRLGVLLPKPEERPEGANPELNGGATPNKKGAASDGTVLAVIASDGLWDVMSCKKAAQIAAESRVEFLSEKGQSSYNSSAEAMANTLLNKARAAKTQDNTTVMAIDISLAVAAVAP